MGSKKSKRQVNFILIQLPEYLKEKVTQLFKMIDSDNSNTINKDETLKFWSKNFPKLNSNEIFDQVDKNNDGNIQMSEWITFWTIVINSGHSEQELSCEVNLF